MHAQGHDRDRHQTLARARLSAAGIEPPRLVTVDDVSRGKPDPEGYLVASTLLGADPHCCLVVEDSSPGLTAGHRAGADTASLRGLPADVMLTDLSHLARLLTLRETARGQGARAAAGL